ncbi:hypothetical protein GKODMF_06680 [Candidatus Electrothrix gigas]
MSRAFFRRKKGELSDFSSSEGIGKHRSKERKSIGRGNQKASLEGKEKHRARESESIARRKGRVSGEGIAETRETVRGKSERIATSSPYLSLSLAFSLLTEYGFRQKEECTTQQYTEEKQELCCQFVNSCPPAKGSKARK